MSPVNLRVPTNASKNIEELKKKMRNHERNDSEKSSISLRIPNRSFASVSDMASTITTPTDTPVKVENSPKSSKKIKHSKKLIKAVSFKSVHQTKVRKTDEKVNK